MRMLVTTALLTCSLSCGLIAHASLPPNSSAFDQEELDINPTQQPREDSACSTVSQRQKLETTVSASADAEFGEYPKVAPEMPATSNSCLPV